MLGFYYILPQSSLMFIWYFIMYPIWSSIRYLMRYFTGYYGGSVLDILMVRSDFSTFVSIPTLLSPLFWCGVASFWGVCRSCLFHCHHSQFCIIEDILPSRGSKCYIAFVRTRTFSPCFGSCWCHGWCHWWSHDIFILTRVHDVFV